MEILLLIVIIVFGASGLYVAITIKRAISSQIESANNRAVMNVATQAIRIDGHITQAFLAAKVERDSLRAKLEQERNAMRAELEQQQTTARELLEQERNDMQERLNRIESVLSRVTSTLVPGLDGIRNVAGQVDARQAELGDGLQEVRGELAQLRDPLARQLSQAQEIERLAKGSESLMTREFSDVSASLRNIREEQSLTSSKLAEISLALDRQLEVGRQAERHDKWAAEQLVIIADLIEVLLNSYNDVAGYLRGRLDSEIVQGNPGLVSRVISTSLRLSQPADDIVQGLFASLCEQLSLSVLLPAGSGSAGSGPYLLWRSTAGQQLEAVLSSMLAACVDDSAESRPGLEELRTMLVVLHASGSGTIRLGPMILNRTHAALLGRVLTAVEGSELGRPGQWDSPEECEERLRGQGSGQPTDLTTWADGQTLVGEDREAL
jgi:hypothetical protein